MKQVINGAILACSGGTAPSSLTVTSQRIAKCKGQLLATDADCAPFSNIAPFGNCIPQTNKSIPPCNLALTGKWSGGQTGCKIVGNPALLDNCTLGCAFGNITITYPGQDASEVGASGATDAEPDEISEEEEKEVNREIHFEEDNNGQVVRGPGQINPDDVIPDPKQYRYELELLYEDGTAPVNLPFKAFDYNKNLFQEGVLDAEGKFIIESCPHDILLIEYAEDAREEPLIEEEENELFNSSGNFSADFIKNGDENLSSYVGENSLALEKTVTMNSHKFPWIFNEIGSGFKNGRTLVDIYYDITLSSIAHKDNMMNAQPLLSSLLFLTEPEDKRLNFENKIAWRNIALVGLAMDEQINKSEFKVLCLTAEPGQITKNELYPEIRNGLKFSPITFMEQLMQKEFESISSGKITNYIDKLNRVSNHLTGEILNRSEDLNRALSDISSKAADEIGKIFTQLKEELQNIQEDELMDYSTSEEFVKIEGVEINAQE